MIAKIHFTSENWSVIKRLAPVVALLCLAISFPSPVHASVKAGDACASLGKTKKVGKSTLVCKKQGKKLVWTKKSGGSTNLAGPTSRPMPTPSAASSPTIAPSPTPSPTPTPRISTVAVPDFLTMGDINDELALKVAWKSFDKRMAKATSPKSTVELRTGPKTDRVRANSYIKSLLRSVAFWDDIYSPAKPVVVALSYSDEYSWMEEQWKMFGMNPKDMGGESAFSSSGTDCNQGSAFLHNGTDPFFWGCLPRSGSVDFIGLQKFAGHEFTHIVQSYLMEWKTGKYKRFPLPFIFTEGSADFYGIATSSENEDEFLNNWSLARTYGYFGNREEKLAIKNWDADKWLWALNENAKNIQIPESKWVQYYSGREVTARLIGLKGHDGFVDLMKRAESSQDWKKSFAEVYGITWDEFAKKMSVELVEITKRLVP